MQYRPTDLGYKYPERSDQHMIEVKHLRDVNCDENYPYVQKGFWWKVKRALLWLLLNPLVFLVVTLRHGLRIHGKKNLKKHKEALKGGAITVCNHVFMWDYLCVLKAIRPKLQYLLAWKTNLEGPNGPLIRWVGGIPIPNDNRRAMVKFNQEVGKVLEEGKWLHVFPEGSMWFYYPDIRPLKKGAFKYAVKYDKPVIPFVITFRPRKGIMRWFSKNPLADLHVGEPIFPDASLPVPDAIDKMHVETYHIMQTMAGIHPGDSTYNVDQNIANYQKTT